MTKRALRITSRLLGWLMPMLVATILAGSAKAVDWTTADELFAKRAEGRDVIAAARAEYLRILSEARTAEEKIRAVSQLGRLAIYEGEMVLPKSATRERKQIFQQCWCESPRALGGCGRAGFVEAIRPGNNGMIDNPAYYYFKGVCLAYWGEANGALASVAHVPTLRSLIEEGRQRDLRFEGGGIGRLGAGVYSNRAADPIGMYDPELALQWIDEALAQDAYPGDPCGCGGSDYYDNWRGRATVLIELGRIDEAKEELEILIEEIEWKRDEGELPRTREAETLWNLETAKKQLEDLQ